MKVLIMFPNDRGAIALPIECAAQAASLVSNGVLVEADGYNADCQWSRKKDYNLSISFVEDDKFQDITPREKRLKDEVELANSERWKQYSRAGDLEKQLAAANAQIELLKSVTVCTQIDT